MPNKRRIVRSFRDLQRKSTRRKITKRRQMQRSRRQRITRSRSRSRTRSQSPAYSSEDIQLFRNYIMRLEDDEKKVWLLSNIERMPYSRNYQPNWSMTNPSDPYYQGLDRIGGYLTYGDDW